MSPQPDRSSQPAQPSPDQSGNQAANPLESAVEKTANPAIDNSAESVPATTPSEKPSLVLKRPVMRPAPPPAEDPPPKAEKLAKAPDTAPTPVKPPVSPAPSPEAVVPVGAPASEESSVPAAPEFMGPRMHPIPPPSEPMQYRAIGLIRGWYTPSEEQFTRGNLLTTDNVNIEAVLLGRVMSLVKNHLDLTQNHLWVVYPRTRDKENTLHAQIVGVWEPEKLSKDTIEESEETSEDGVDSGEVVEAMEDASLAMPTNIPQDEIEDNYFSIRGEVIFQSQDPPQVVVKIRQTPRKQVDKAKAFKLKLEGAVEGKGVGYFWDFQVQRSQELLVIQKATSIGIVPPKKGGGKKPARKPFKPGGKRFPPRTGSDRPSINRPTEGGKPPEGAPTSQRPIPKPVKKRDRPASE